MTLCMGIGPLFTGLSAWLRSCAVHGETGRATSAPLALAEYLDKDPVLELTECMDFLARQRAHACMLALVAMGCPGEQLYATWDGMGGHVRVDFRPDGYLDGEVDEGAQGEVAELIPDKCSLHREFRRSTIRAHGPRHMPPRQSPGLRNRTLPWAAADLEDAVTKFPRLARPEVLRPWLELVARDGDFAPFVRMFCGNIGTAGAGARGPSGSGRVPNRGTTHGRALGRRLSGGALDGCAEVASMSLSDLLHFDSARLAKLGVCSPLVARRLAAELEGLRRVVTADGTLSGTELYRGPLMPDWLWGLLCYRGRVAAPRSLSGWLDPPKRTGSADEARSRILAVLKTHVIQFNGAGEDDVIARCGIEQAWNVDHADQRQRAANHQTLRRIAWVLRDFDHVRFTVHGETGKAKTAPSALAAHLGLDAVADVRTIMDTLALRRARACANLLVDTYGVPREQLTVSYTGEGGAVAVDFIPHAASLGTERRSPLRFVHLGRLSIDGWRTLHLALNCHFNPLPSVHCAHAVPCTHRSPTHASVDEPARLSVRSWRGKRQDWALSTPEDAPRPAAPVPAAGHATPDGVTVDGAAADGAAVDAADDGGARLKAFYSSTRTPCPHVGEAGIGPLSWKSAALWSESSKWPGAVWLWESACCIDQVAVSKGLVTGDAYASEVLDALGACDQLWVHAASDYSDSLYTVLELMAWHASRRIHPSTTRLLSQADVTSIAGRTARVPLYDAARDHAQWLRRQLAKHGDVGRAVASAFCQRAGVDVRDARLLHSAFAALEALAATNETPAPSSHYAPRHHWLADARPASDFDYGFITAHATPSGSPRMHPSHGTRACAPLAWRRTRAVGCPRAAFTPRASLPGWFPASSRRLSSARTTAE